MSASRFSSIRGCSPQALAVLMAIGMIAAGIGFPPAVLAGAAVATDDERSNSQPCEETPDESAEDEESAGGKHAAVLGVAVIVAAPTSLGHGIADSTVLRVVDSLLDAAPIRGPPTAV